MIDSGHEKKKKRRGKVVKMVWFIMQKRKDERMIQGCLSTFVLHALDLLAEMFKYISHASRSHRYEHEPRLVEAIKAWMPASNMFSI